MTRPRERWLGATGHRVPEIALEGTVDVEGTLVLDSVDDVPRLREAYERGIPILVRAATAEQVRAALSRPEVACALVPSEELLELDLRELTYG